MQTTEYRYNTEPYAHQIEAEKFIADGRTDYFALFMEQGTGKTKTYIDFAENMYLAHRIDRVMVIAPNGVHRQWAESEVRLHGFVPSDCFIWQSDKKHRALFEKWDSSSVDTLRYFMVNVEAFSVKSYLDIFRQFVAHGKTAVVIDEATSIKTPDSARTLNIVQGLSKVVKYGRRVVSVTPLAVSRAILTGTPEAKGPYGLWSMFEFLCHDYFGRNYYAFKARYGMEKLVYFPGLMRPVRKPLQTEDFAAVRKRAAEGLVADQIALELSISNADVEYILANPQVNTPYKNLAELKALLSKRAFTVTKAQCLDLPAKVYQVRMVKMNDEQRRVYNEMAKNAYAMYEKGALDSKNRVAIRIRLRQIAGGFFPQKYDTSSGYEQELEETKSIPIGEPEKYKAVAQMIEENAPFPLIVTTAFRAEAEHLQRHLSDNYSCVCILGGMTKTERYAAEDAFKQGKAQILIATESTIAKGYNFQFCHNTYMYSCTESTENRMQLEDRTHRIGQGESPLYVDFVTENSVDEAVQKILKGDIAFQEYMRSEDPADFFKIIGGIK